MKVINVRSNAPHQYIGRGTYFGNPFYIGRDGTRDEVILKYTRYIVKKPDLWEHIDGLIEDGRDLGCHCAPLACHGDVLLRLIKKRREMMK